MTRAEVDAVRAQPDPCMSCGENRRLPAPERCRQPGGHAGTPPDPHPRAVLAVRMQPNEAGADTIRDHLAIVLRKVWDEAKGRSWRQEVEEALVRAEMVDGTFEAHGEDSDPDELLMEWDADKADRLVKSAIDALGRG